MCLYIFNIFCFVYIYIFEKKKDSLANQIVMFCLRPSNIRKLCNLLQKRKTKQASKKKKKNKNIKKKKKLPQKKNQN